MPQAYQGDIAESIASTPRAGQLAENTGPNNLRSSLKCGVLIAPGRAICSVVDGVAKLPTSSAEALGSLGVSVFLPMKSDAVAPINQEDFQVDEFLLYLTTGEIWVAVEAAVTAGQQALVRHTANGGLTILGGFRGDANTGAVALPGTRFVTSTAGAGFAKLRLNLAI